MINTRVEFPMKVVFDLKATILVLEVTKTFLTGFTYYCFTIQRIVTINNLPLRVSYYEKDG